MALCEKWIIFSEHSKENISEKFPVKNNKEDSNIERELVIEVLLTEYKNIHERVIRNVEQYEQTNVQILMLVGVLLFFGITNYSSEDSYISLFVNLTFIVALPVISLCAILLGVTHLIKVMILGDFLKIVENKVNKVLEDQSVKYGFGGRVLSWEWWRVKDGYAKKGLKGVFSVISFDIIIIILIITITIISFFIRQNYILSINYIYSIKNHIWFNLFVQFPKYFLFVSAICIIIAIIVYSFRRCKTINRSNNDKELISFSDK